jgi:hypothetical protein
MQVGDTFEEFLSMVPDAPVIIQGESTRYVKGLEIPIKVVYVGYPSPAIGMILAAHLKYPIAPEVQPTTNII